MKKLSSLHKRHRFPAEIIQHTVWLYYRFNMSHRDIEDLLAERGINVSYESVRLWCNKFGPQVSKRLKRRHQGFGDTFYIDEVFVKIRGKQHYLWRAVDQDGEVIDVFLQAKRDAAAAKRFFERLLRNNRGEPRKIVTDDLRSYGVAHRELIPDTIHVTSQYANNRAELSHQSTRVRERNMRCFKSPLQAKRFLSVHAAVHNLFNLGRNLISAEHYRSLRQGAFASWEYATAL
jgi:putative transposase